MIDATDTITISVFMACKLGLRKAICLQQLHSLLNKDNPDIHMFEGKRWIHKKYEDWHKYLPFMSIGAIKEHFIKLQTTGLVLYRRDDKIKYYSIDYDALDKLYQQNNRLKFINTERDYQ